MKIMTFNLRMDTEHDGINSFTNRFQRVIDTIRNENADIIGFQEVTDSMRPKIRAALKEYTTVGCGRGWNYKDEAMLIAFKPDLFELISLENVWLSETPSVPGSKYGFDHSPCPRMYTSLLLKHNDIEKPFRFINTHLDHTGERARVQESTQLTADIAKYEEKFILTGDFNAEPSAKEIKMITENLASKGCIDCTLNIGPTFHAFGALPQEKQVKIDYIFTNGACKSVHRVEDIPVNGQYYSDHFAVCAEIEI